MSVCNWLYSSASFPFTYSRGWKAVSYRSIGVVVATAVIGN